MPVDTGADTIARVLDYEELLRTNHAQYTAADIATLDLDPYWQQVLLLFEAYRQITHDETETVTRDVLGALRPGLRWLCGHRWQACAGVEL
jgi:thymidylate synthase